MKKISFICDVCEDLFPEEVLADAELRVSGFDGVAGDDGFTHLFEHICRPCRDGLIAAVESYVRNR